MSGTPPILWQPSDEFRRRTVLADYMEWLASERGLRFKDYDGLWKWSVTEIESFWESIWDYFEVQSTQPYGQVLTERAMPGARWFTGAELNYAEHIFRGRGDDEVAVVHASERRALAELTWGELRALTAALAAALRAEGVEPGDRVVAYMPNIAEAVAAFLACASIGATWSSCSPDFGARSVVDRFQQIEPKVLLAVDGYRYNGRDFDRMDAVEQIRSELPTVQRTVVLQYGAEAGDLDRIPDGIRWDDFVRGGEGAALEFARLAFDHPLWVLYSSGTTGLPKAIVHGQGGILLEQLKKGHLHSNLRPGERMFWFTTTGWMMWNFLVGTLLTGATIVLYDGSPAFPDMSVLWDLAERARITTFGTSAGYISACMKAGVEPARGRDLSALGSVGSTGSPLAPEGFAWVYEQLGPETWLYSTSGGTDLCTAFVGACPLLPVYEGELQARSLGASVEAWDEQGRPLVDEVGELVITEPMPSMPIYFWGDVDGERLRESYFSMYPGVWRHGDWIEITSRGTAIIYGRSDSTINRGGVRMGTSEIYRAVMDVPEVVDALVVDVPRDGEAWMPLFVVLREGAELDDELIAQIRARIRDDCSPRHVPNEVVQVPGVPRTLSGKVLEVPVKRVLMGTDPDKAASRDSLQNPDVFDWFVDYAQRVA